MRVLNFSRNHAAVGESTNDWSQQELADFYRAQRLLFENGVSIGIDRGISDAGDPWMVFFDTASEEVFLHVARIERQCHLVCDALSLRISAPRLDKLMADFEGYVRDFLAIRRDTGSNVILHPASRIIMSLSALFLLFKLEKNEAYAKDFVQKDGADSELGAGRIGDKALSPAMRVQAAFSRAFDSVELPAAAAVLAGLIVAGEIALVNDGIEGAGIVNAEEQKISSAQYGVDVQVATVVSTDHAGGHEESDVAPKEHEIVLAKNDVNVVIPHHVIELVEELSAPQNAIVDGADVQQVSRDYNTLSQGARSVGEVVAASLAEEMTVDTALDAVSPAPQISKAVLTLGSLILADKDAFVISSFDTEKVNKKELAANLVGELNVSNIDIIDDKVGLYVETRYNSSEFNIVFEYLRQKIPSFEFEYLGGKVLIEDKNIELMKFEDVGIWTNVMADGSTFTVAGSIGIIDDVKMLLA